ncbi:DUF2214 family protein [Zooshikella marina]|uniref:DUF2214 family protein n=1 Tax=Zooshikella ganghwensis TaxID=202772 RepID=A0A4P9VUU0_9GAMM|nr:DUF2214 family protein [Zooshikella ganghwensis]MBU2708673.1 DUF2214 family protein [Zooshikella ganghwensis]RDH46204.1 DUF2214 family protein [Zooshikella ganghwensis]
MTEIIIRYFHYIGIIGLGATLVAEHLLIAKELTSQQIRKIAIVDAIYGISALVTLTAGLLLWFVVGKPADYYLKNWIFHTKISLFILIVLLSIYPTIFFIKSRKSALKNISVSKSIPIIIRVELTLFLLMPLLALLVARGYGSF